MRDNILEIHKHSIYDLAVYEHDVFFDWNRGMDGVLVRCACQGFKESFDGGGFGEVYRRACRAVEEHRDDYR